MAVVGLARSGRAAAAWLARESVRVYASDASEAPAAPAALEALRAAGVVVDVGGHDLERIARSCAVVASPGVPPGAPPLAVARGAGVPILAELELGWRVLRAAGTRFIVVTGTNGKSTTTSITAQILLGGGVAAGAAGNIGRPLLDVALAGERPAWVVAEASSFQLHDAPTLAPEITVLTNLAPNHLDRYVDIAAYYGDKARLYRNATSATVHVVNGDDALALPLLEHAPGHRREFALRPDADAGYAGGHLTLDGLPLLPRDALPLIGFHNVQNALAAALAAGAAGLPHAAIAEGLRAVTGLPNRLEMVRTVDEVQWVNDSKSTNVTSTIVAVRAMERPYVLLLGGRHKGESYTRLADAFGGRCRGLIAYGESARQVVTDLSGRVPVMQVDTLAEAVEVAAERAAPGEAVLLSPACSSYDQFTDYEQRGATFRQLVEAR